jgi:hypothetical protein
MSPRKTCQSCGSSSREYLRQSAAKALVTRGSEEFFRLDSLPHEIRSTKNRRDTAQAGVPHIVRNFRTQSSRPFRPTRAWATSGEQRESVNTATAITTSNGNSATSRNAAAMRSIRFTHAQNSLRAATDWPGSRWSSGLSSNSTPEAAVSLAWFSATVTVEGFRGPDLKPESRQMPEVRCTTRVKVL